MPYGQPLEIVKDAARYTIYNVPNWRGDGYKQTRREKYPCAGGPLNGEWMATEAMKWAPELLGFPDQYREYSRAGGGNSPSMVFVWIPEEILKQKSK